MILGVAIAGIPCPERRVSGNLKRRLSVYTSGDDHQQGRRSVT
jgi:orotate phosphoribosyltransferase-like protein